MTGLSQRKSRLPEPSREARAHSQRLLAEIKAAVGENDGWISFSQFMQLALYAPGLGYYSAGARKFGEAGDFVTAPEMSSLFSRCLAHVCNQVLSGTGGGSILELGGGSGVMAADILSEFKELDVLPENYFLLEISADLRKRQQELIRERVPDLAGRVQWLNNIPTEKFDGVILANEVVDALPCERFIIGNGTIQALGVGFEGRELCETAGPADPCVTRAVNDLQERLGAFPAGYMSEIRPSLSNWLDTVTTPLRQGIALFIDYGLPEKELYARERGMGTLLCHYRHRAHAQPLINVGLQDITAWVDFTALANAAADAGMMIKGYTTQAHFLLSAGLDDLFAESEVSSLKERLELAREVKLLTLPGEMGERFKVLGVGRNFDLELDGFTGRDLAATL